MIYGKYNNRQKDYLAMTINREYLETIVYSQRNTDEIFEELLNAAKSAKLNGTPQSTAVRLFGELGGDGTKISQELDSCISSVLEIVVGYCSPDVRIWEEIWDNTEE